MVLGDSLNIAQRKTKEEAMKITVLILLIWHSIPVSSQNLVTKGKRVVVIDAGHGGIDSGALSEKGLQEKEVVLDIALSIIAWNKNLLESKYEMYLTRSTDTLISLQDRTRLVKVLQPDIFISLHCNHIEDSSIRGVETYTYDSNMSSIITAEVISSILNQKIGFKKRTVKQANFQVLRETSEYCPGVLLELGYLSNSDESDYLKEKENRSVIALAIIRSLQIRDSL